MKAQTLRLTLLTANVMVLASAAWVFMTPAQPHWLEAHARASAAPSPPPVRPAEPAKAQLAAVWLHPLFSPGRQPDAHGSQAQAPALAGMTLSGVLLDGERRFAYVRDGSRPATKVALGDTLASGWTLSQLGATHATFTRAGQTHTLNMPLLRLPAPSTAPALTLPRTTTP
ncbi:general secretion pathway protein GspN [Pseudomonas sp. LB-090624]|uniref:type II secretion system protein N n=1 Tax=Pseudomonas sp. LB-090624 TaxID=2213079 RepID=UPI000D85CDB1|nr:type II secretion system protein N [Pseudomonas sp. LB-090624]PYB81004.1 general secretion pathway protein GspN [Pseudomonas sp. LB-090624]